MSDGYKEFAMSREHWDAKRKEQIAALQAQHDRLVQEHLALVERMAKYGTHLGSCESWRHPTPNGFPDPARCTCGWTPDSAIQSPPLGQGVRSEYDVGTTPPVKGMARAEVVRGEAPPGAPTAETAEAMREARALSPSEGCSTISPDEGESYTSHTTARRSGLDQNQPVAGGVDDAL